MKAKEKGCPGGTPEVGTALLRGDDRRATTPILYLRVNSRIKGFKAKIRRPRSPGVGVLKNGVLADRGKQGGRARVGLVSN